MFFIRPPVACAFFLLGMTTLSNAGAQALERPFPQHAKRGVMVVGSYPQVSLNGSQRRLSAGGWIRNVRNTVDLPVTLQGQELTVNYTENQQGEIDRAWILSPQEASQRPPSTERQSGASFSSPDPSEPVFFEAN